jgi:predicted acyltransferase
MRNDMTETPTQNDAGDFQQQRLQSLDAYRGLIMISLAFVGFGLADTAANHLKRDPHSGFWKEVRYQFSHAEWVGCSYWDLIQPSFMFMVGVSMPYSYARRQRLGESYPRMLNHAMTRSLVLILLSIFLMSHSRRHIDWSFMNVLAQIGLGYTFVFLLWGRPFRTQAVAAVVILAGTWMAYELYPHAGINLASGSPEVGVSKEWADDHLQGVRPAWHKNANVGHAVDVWVLNRFPRPEPFVFNRGGYQTINFIPSIVTMLFGLMCGELLRSGRPPVRKLGILVTAGILGLAAGELLHVTGASPLVKRIWTPSWTLFSTGWCCLILAGLFAIIDMHGFRRWTFPLVVVGMNSIAIYCMSMMLKPWTARQLQTLLGEGVFTFHGGIDPAWAPTVEAVMVGLVFWLICYYMYRNKIFIRI